MVTTSVASPAAAHSLLVNPEQAGAETAQGRTHGLGAEPVSRPVVCSILTPSGALLARALVRPRPATLPADTYAVEVSQVEPAGALEPLLRTNPQVVLRTPHEAQLALRIDHIIGPRERRTYYLQTLTAPSD
ncbi:MAG: hypothetical protein F4X58_03665 [Chloroflexi bacterium]|nr:hypothetical protein [Chloroflexota bacterium]MYC00997.1 hypothetical protein [Chloroflexota bacterium]